jgi:hypothetical protein
MHICTPTCGARVHVRLRTALADLYRNRTPRSGFRTHPDACGHAISAFYGGITATRAMARLLLSKGGMKTKTNVKAGIAFRPRSRFERGGLTAR